VPCYLPLRHVVTQLGCLMDQAAKAIAAFTRPSLDGAHRSVCRAGAARGLGVAGSGGGAQRTLRAPTPGGDDPRSAGARVAASPASKAATAMTDTRNLAGRAIGPPSGRWAFRQLVRETTAFASARLATGPWPGSGWVVRHDRGTQADSGQGLAQGPPNGPSVRPAPKVSPSSNSPTASPPAATRPAFR
jgi:hypothetical protein